MKRAILLFLLILLASGAYAQEPVVRRFAVIAGASDGGYDRVRLRYAASDARTFAAVMEAMGGLEPQDRLLLIDPDFTEFQDALRAVQAMIHDSAGSSSRKELIVYYSGHADASGGDDCAVSGKGAAHADPYPIGLRFRRANRHRTAVDDGKHSCGAGTEPGADRQVG